MARLYQDSLDILDQEIISQLEQFRHKLYEVFDHRTDTLIELLDALSSTPYAQLVAELIRVPSSAENTTASMMQLLLFSASDPKIAKEERRA